MALPMPPSSQSLFAEGDTTVTSERRGATGLLRISGPCSPALGAWLGKVLQQSRGPLALNLRGLTGADEPFLRQLAEDACRRSAALVDVPADLLDTLERMGVRAFLSALSCEEALLEKEPLATSLRKDQAAVAEVASRFEINPLWRRLDQEGTWLCPLCGTLVEEVRVPPETRPDAGTLLSMRGHLLARCAAWQSGRRTPLPMSMLDAFLGEANRRKASQETERRHALTRQVETLQERVESVEDLERSVDEAKRRQLHLLPISPPPDPIAEIAVVYRPLQSVGGDLLDFYELPGDRFGASIGDVSGHGIEAAIVMGMAKMAWRVRMEAGPTLREAMIGANSDLFRELRRAAFVTGVAAWIERPTRRMTYIRAGHPPPLLRRGSGRLEELDAPGLPFGADDGKRFVLGLKEREVTLAAGDVLLLYTDGVIEAGTPHPFGVERLRQAFKAAPAALPADATLACVTGALDAFLAGAAPGDDITLVCLKIR
jgi:serine phosphatase RsbU (regulator of sigma subunit)